MQRRDEIMINLEQFYTFFINRKIIQDIHATAEIIYFLSNTTFLITGLKTRHQFLNLLHGMKENHKL